MNNKELIFNNFYCGDCLEIMKQIPNDYIDLILTSPPYNTNMKYDNWNDNMSFEDYWKWCKLWLSECYRILKPDGRCAIVHYLSYSNGAIRYSPISMLDNIQREIGFKFHTIVLWADATRTKYTAWGSWLSASAPYINTSYEGILITYKEQWKKKNRGKSTISKEEFIEACSGVWNIGTARHKDHPAVFPERLASRVINLLTYEGDIVLDPFCGIGTTCISAYKLNRKFIGIDISPRYIDIALKKLKGGSDD